MPAQYLKGHQPSPFSWSHYFTMLAKKNNPHNFFDNSNLSHSDLSLQIPNIWDRRFDAKMVELGKAHGVWIDVFGELRKKLGRLYDVVSQTIYLSRRFNQNGFHFSALQFIEHMGGTISESSLYRRKNKARELGIFHCYGGVKNRTHFVLHNDWFKSFINDYFIKLGILHRQNDGSHIISIDRANIIIHTHSEKDVSFMNIDRNTEDAYNEYCKMRKNEKVKTLLVAGLSKTSTLPTPEHAAIFEKLRKINVDQFSAARWAKLYYLNDLKRVLKEAKLKRNPGAWLRTIIRKSDERNFNHNFDMATIRLEDEPGARKKAAPGLGIAQALSAALQPAQSVFKTRFNRADDEGQIVELVGPVGPVKPHVWSCMLLQKESEASSKVVVKHNAERKLTRKEIVPTTPAGWEAKLLREELEREGVVFT